MNYNREMATMIEAYLQDPSVRAAIAEDVGSPIAYTYDWKHNRILVHGSTRKREFSITEMYFRLQAMRETIRRAEGGSA